LRDALAAKREMQDTLTKSRIINKGMVNSEDRLEKQNLERENQRIASYQSLAKISEATNKIVIFMEKGYTLLGTLLEKIDMLVDYVGKLSGARMLKSWFTGGKDK
jgi:hypothetical protein